MDSSITSIIYNGCNLSENEWIILLMCAPDFSSWWCIFPVSGPAWRALVSATVSCVSQYDAESTYKQRLEMMTRGRLRLLDSVDRHTGFLTRISFCI